MAFSSAPALLTIKEVMERLAMGKNAVYDLIDEGKLEAFQSAPNCKFRITARSVELHLARIALSPDLMVEQMVAAVKWLTPTERARLAAKLDAMA